MCLKVLRNLNNFSLYEKKCTNNKTKAKTKLKTKADYLLKKLLFPVTAFR